MKHLLLPVFIALGCASQAQVVSTEFLQSYTLQEVYQVMEDLGVPPGFLTANYEVDCYRVIYMTPHPNGTEVEVSGLICVPAGGGCAFPLSSYQHGTIARRIDAPSFGGTESDLQVLYASAGYVAVAADYIGLGTSQGMHPYVHADSEATTCRDLIRAAHELQDSLGYLLNDELFIWGYSQGGHATAALQRLIETDPDQEFILTASAPMAGPYDVSGVQAEVITSNNPYPTPGYLPYVIFSYQSVYGNLYTDINEVFLPEYAAILPGLFDGNTSMGTINNACPDIPNQVLQPALLETFQQDPNHPMRIALADNDLYDWIPQIPTLLLYCNGDDQVNFMNSIVAYNAFTGAGSTTVQEMDLGEWDHGFCAPFAMFEGYSFFESLREPSFNPAVTSEVSGVSASGNADGTITVTVDSPGIWSYSWSNKATGLSLAGLAEGEYILTITAENGCSVSYVYTIDVQVGVAESTDSALRAWPVPAGDLLYIEIPGHMQEAELTLSDLTGRVVMRTHASNQNPLDVTHLPAGQYIIRCGENALRIAKS
jgi:hypothetical protein